MLRSLPERSLHWSTSRPGRFNNTKLNQETITKPVDYDMTHRARLVRVRDSVADDGSPRSVTTSAGTSLPKPVRPVRSVGAYDKAGRRTGLAPARRRSACVRRTTTRGARPGCSSATAIPVLLRLLATTPRAALPASSSRTESRVGSATGGADRAHLHPARQAARWPARRYDGAGRLRVWRRLCPARAAVGRTACNCARATRRPLIETRMVLESKM